MNVLVYIISALLILLAIYFLIKEIKEMLKGKCCEDCKGCSVKDSCSAKDEKPNK